MNKVKEVCATYSISIYSSVTGLKDIAILKDGEEVCFVTLECSAAEAMKAGHIMIDSVKANGRFKRGDFVVYMDNNSKRTPDFIYKAKMEYVMLFGSGSINSLTYILKGDMSKDIDDTINLIQYLVDTVEDEVSELNIVVDDKGKLANGLQLIDSIYSMSKEYRSKVSFK